MDKQTAPRTDSEVRKLLDEAAEYFGDAEACPNGTWWRRYFVIDGSHMILTDEGWESGSGKAEYQKQADEDGVPVSDFILDEVNEPPPESSLSTTPLVDNFPPKANSGAMASNNPPAGKDE